MTLISSPMSLNENVSQYCNIHLFLECNLLLQTAISKITFMELRAYDMPSREKDVKTVLQLRVYNVIQFVSNLLKSHYLRIIKMNVCIII